MTSSLWRQSLACLPHRLLLQNRRTRRYNGGCARSTIYNGSDRAEGHSEIHRKQSAVAHVYISRNESPVHSP